jgi:hypothetical protein
MEVLQTKNIDENGEVKECKIENKSISDEIIQVRVLWFLEIGKDYLNVYLIPHKKQKKLTFLNLHTTKVLLHRCVTQWITQMMKRMKPISFECSHVLKVNSHFYHSYFDLTLLKNPSF